MTTDYKEPKKPLYPYTCKFCGAPSQLEPIDQTPPPDYCHPSDHEAEDDYERFEEEEEEGEEGEA